MVNIVKKKSNLSIRSCLLISQIKCLKSLESLWLLDSKVWLSEWLSDSVSEWQGHLLSCQTLVWTAKKRKYIFYRVSKKTYIFLSSWLAGADRLAPGGLIFKLWMVTFDWCNASTATRRGKAGCSSRETSNSGMATHIRSRHPEQANQVVQLNEFSIYNFFLLGTESTGCHKLPTVATICQQLPQVVKSCWKLTKFHLTSTHSDSWLLLNW